MASYEDHERDKLVKEKKEEEENEIKTIYLPRGELLNFLLEFSVRCNIHTLLI